MGQELRNDTTNWAKIHKSEVSNEGGGRYPKMGWIGPAHGSAEPEVWPNPPRRRWMQGFFWTVWIASLWRLEGITDLSNRYNRHYLPI